MIRHSKLDISYLQKLRDMQGHSHRHLPNKYKTINGVQVKITSQRYKLFQENKFCVKCGIEGTFLAIEKHSPEIEKYHINMYGINENGDEILMTKDHIIPKSKGGENILSNYQTMCSKCNSDKGNGDSKSLRMLFDDYVYKKTKKDIRKVDKLCAEFNIQPSDFWYYYLKSEGDFFETDFLTNILTYFYYYLDSETDKLFENLNIEMNYFFFYSEEDMVSLGDNKEGIKEFHEKIVDADFSVKKKLINNKIFSHLMKKSKINIFTVKQTRVLKLENLS